MDLKFSKEDEAFRLMARKWISENLPESFKTSSDPGAVSSRSRRLPWYQKLAEQGWLCASWPKEAGGPGWTLAQQAIFQEEASAQGAPGPDMGVYMVGPLLIEYGTEEQKKRYLPPIAAAKEFWCQGYSEPNAGSDLANLGLRAERDGDDYILNGQKIWTSGANEAEQIFILARTDAKSKKKQTGISFLLAPMDTPGIRIEPIKQITDESHFYETFFTDVRVPVANRVGGENEGWTIAKRLLAHERVGLGAARTFRSSLNRAIRLAKDKKGANGRVSDRVTRQKLAHLSMQLDALAAVDYRVITQLLHGNMPGPESSIVKLFGSELFQHICDVALDTLGPETLVWNEDGSNADHGWSKLATQSRAYSIFSGTSEIQRNIISERVLGMPR
jgi:alkylation response protein AidB-like acyl-CoA dehydrogenase